MTAFYICTLYMKTSHNFRVGWYLKNQICARGSQTSKCKFISSHERIWKKKACKTKLKLKLIRSATSHQLRLFSKILAKWWKIQVINSWPSPRIGISFRSIETTLKLIIWAPSRRPCSAEAIAVWHLAGI